MSTTELFHDPVLLIIFSALFSAVFTLLIGLYIHAREFPRKELTFRVLHSKKVKAHTITRRLSQETRVLSRRGRVRSGVYEIEVKVRNTGRAPIEHTHFGMPVTINFGRYASVLAATVSKASPAYLPVSCNHDGHDGKSVRVEVALLNRGNWVRVKVQVQDPSFVKVVAHVAGTERIYSMDDSLGRGSVKPALLGLMLMLMGSVMYSAIGSPPNFALVGGQGVIPLSEVTPSLLAVLVSLAGGYLLMFGSMGMAAALAFTAWSWARNSVPLR
jgi:hypothetical protein